LGTGQITVACGVITPTAAMFVHSALLSFNQFDILANQWKIPFWLHDTERHRLQGERINPSRSFGGKVTQKSHCPLDTRIVRWNTATSHSKYGNGGRTGTFAAAFHGPTAVWKLRLFQVGDSAVDCLSNFSGINVLSLYRNHGKGKNTQDAKEGILQHCSRCRGAPYHWLIIPIFGSPVNDLEESCSTVRRSLDNVSPIMDNQGEIVNTFTFFQ
jgi:hypothetical protein